MRTPLAILVVLAVFAVGTTLAMATGTGNGGNPHGTAGHLQKPGCGPDKTDGVAGNSGQHDGQPPKADDRQDCPNPPGQQGNTSGNGNGNNSNKSTSTSSSSSTSSGGNGNKNKNK